MATQISTPKKDLIKEHAKLVRTLRSGSPEEQKAEAADQAKELSGYRKAKGRKGGRGTNRR
mgnify:CR=1 FL=1